MSRKIYYSFCLLFLLNCLVHCQDQNALDKVEACESEDDPAECNLGLLQLETEISLLQVDLKHMPSANSSSSAVVQHDSSQLKDSQRRSRYYKQPMDNFWDTQYAADFGMGDQHLKGVLDTGSYEILVFSKECTSEDCLGTNRAQFFDSRQSHTYSTTEFATNHCYGSGCAFSRMGHEDMNFGPLEVQHQYFWEAVEVDMPIVEQATFQAVVGLGPPLTADEIIQDDAAMYAQAANIYPKLRVHAAYSNAMAEAVTAEQTLLENLDTTTFSVCLEKDFGAPGYVIWNDANPQDSSPSLFNEVEVAGEITWGVILDTAKLAGGDQQLDETLGCSAGTCAAILDSGTSLMVLPTEIGNRILDVINSLPDPCDLEKLPNLEFNLGGVQHSLPPEAYIGEVHGVVPPHLQKYVPHWMRELQTCSALFMLDDAQTQHGPQWIIGMPFFREYYTTYDMGSSPSSGPEERKIFTARNTAGDCEYPSAEGNSGVAMAQTSSTKRARRRIDASKIRVSRKIMQSPQNGKVPF